MNNTTPEGVKNAYFKNWHSDNESGFTLYIPVDQEMSIALKHAYFKQKKIMLVKENDKALYTGKYTYPKKEGDMVMSDDPKQEFKNKVPAGIERIPFRLKEGECIIVYSKEGTEGHFSIENVPEQ
ncbi:hypothetical protein U6A24_19680 [Aquimarina gracilis]|uniref:Uncharacterized protein n=2 Tax=Aquimarina gracilis TaxID=874422 RepID=A0ABU6A0P5_9FLAO|nr:hypothetical protein [Aquimarina gracilis]